MEFLENELQIFHKEKKAHKAKKTLILLFLFGILCAVFFIDCSRYIGEYQKINRDEALVYEGKYEKYIHNTQGHSDSYYIVLDDGTTLMFPVQRQSLRDAIKEIEEGQDIIILAHPNSQIILSLCVDGIYIIDFDETQNYMEESLCADEWFLTGVVVLVLVVSCGLVVMIKKISKKQK